MEDDDTDEEDEELWGGHDLRVWQLALSWNLEVVVLTLE
jgi:hypothetical protein